MVRLPVLLAAAVWSVFVDEDEEEEDDEFLFEFGRIGGFGEFGL